MTYLGVIQTFLSRVKGGKERDLIVLLRCSSNVVMRVSFYLTYKFAEMINIRAFLSLSKDSCFIFLEFTLLFLQVTSSLLTMWIHLDVSHRFSKLSALL